MREGSRAQTRGIVRKGSLLKRAFDMQIICKCKLHNLNPWHLLRHSFFKTQRTVKVQKLEQFRLFSAPDGIIESNEIQARLPKTPDDRLFNEG
jgi:hypothetical protein